VYVAEQSLAGGVAAELQGGNFGDGFYQAGLSAVVGAGLNAAASQYLPIYKDVATGDPGSEGAFTRFVTKTVLGGTASTLTGGKFANGAASAGLGAALREISPSLTPDRMYQTEQQPEMQNSDAPREPSLDSVEAFEHYRGGTGTPIRISFGEIDTSGVRPSQFDAVQSALGEGPRDAVINIDARLAFATSGDQAFFLGNITLRLQGILAIRASGTFEFSGTLKSFDDVYDFNRANRGFFAETLTGFGRDTEGTPFDIEIRGAKRITESGRLP